MQAGEFSIPENSDRLVSWDSADVPDIFPKVSESATVITVDTDDNEDFVYVMWDRMEPDEIVAIIRQHRTISSRLPCFERRKTNV